MGGVKPDINKYISKQLGKISLKKMNTEKLYSYSVNLSSGTALAVVRMAARVVERVPRPAGPRGRSVKKERECLIHVPIVRGRPRARLAFGRSGGGWCFYLGSGSGVHEKEMRTSRRGCTLGDWTFG